LAKPPVDDARLDKLFPINEAAPSAGTFELGLVLGGTVSAGAYTAGALDYLLEVLEAWYRAGEPLHHVTIKMAAGTSGGAVCSAILGLLSSRKVPHVSADATPVGHETNPVPTGNPLWDLWVNDFQMSRLLMTDDLGADADQGSGAVVHPTQHVPALLNCRMIDDSGVKLAAFGTSPGQALPYFPSPFRIAVTLANLRGIPYQILDIPKIETFSGAAFVQHDDFARFAFPNGASAVPSATSVGKREDEFWLGAGAGSDFVGYETLVAYATASGAMPVGLAARTLTRPSAHYQFRPKVRPTPTPPDFRVVDWPEPAWTGLPDVSTGTYTFTAVDGGTFNNDPVAIAHRALAGLVGINPRDKSDANRAIFMIDPLASGPKPIDKTGKSLVSVVKDIFGAVIGGSRYLTADLELFADKDVFSRFQLVPFRKGEGKTGEAALAGSGLFAAAGWCARPFRVHDFLLGRQNMQIYLRRELVLAGDNPLFKNWPSEVRKDWALNESGDRIDVDATTPGNTYFLPVIPDKTLNPPFNLPTWPVGAFNPDNLKAPLEHRLREVTNRLLADNLGGGAIPWLVNLLLVPGIVDAITSAVITSFKSELQEAGLST
jgi:hypothetical protein